MKETQTDEVLRRESVRYRDLRDQRTNALQKTFVAAAKYFGKDFIETHDDY
jgi:hypothetical protein